MTRPNAVIAWEGPSLFTGRPIRLVVSCLGKYWKSKNEKTGTMVQISVVQADVNPSLARGTDRERDVCGTCPAMRLRENWCYAVWMAWILGQVGQHWKQVSIIQAASHIREAGRPVRFGAYGDVAAVPFEQLEPLFSVANRFGWTGYTHAWRTCDQRLRGFLMASVETGAEQSLAIRAGWRTFRIRPPAGGIGVDEIVCPYESTNGKVKCESCRLCQGTKTTAKHIVITIHGQRACNFVKREAA